MKSRYYYTIDGQEFGPVDANQLRELNLPAETKFRRESCDYAVAFDEILADTCEESENPCVKIEKNSESLSRLFAKKNP